MGRFAIGRRMSGYWILDALRAIGRFAIGRRAAYWVLDTLWAMGRNDLSAPLVELAGWNEIWEWIGAWYSEVKDMDVLDDEICIAEFAKLLNDSL